MQNCSGSDLLLILSSYTAIQRSLPVSVRVPIHIPVSSAVSDNTEMSVRFTLETLYDLFFKNDDLVSNSISISDYENKHHIKTIDTDIVKDKKKIENKSDDSNNIKKASHHRKREISAEFLRTPFKAVIDFVHMAGNNGVSNISGIDSPSSRGKDQNNNDNDNSHSSNNCNYNMTVEKLMKISVNHNILDILSCHPSYSSSTSSVKLLALNSNIDTTTFRTSIFPLSSSHPPPPFSTSSTSYSTSSSTSTSSQALTSKLPLMNSISPIWISNFIQGRYVLIGSEISYPALTTDEVNVRTKLQDFLLQNSNKI